MQLFKKNFIFLFLMLMGAMVMAQETYLDNFSSVSYSNNNGTQNFSGSWNEINDGNNPSNGRIRVTGNELRFEDISRNNRRIQRSADLTGAASAVLSMDWRTSGLDGSGLVNSEQLNLQISSDGTSFTTIGTFTGSQSSTFSQDISSYISANTTIRLINLSTWTYGDWESGEYVYIDDVQISAVFSALISIDDVSVDENAGTANFTATHLGVSTSGSFTVDYTTTDGSATAASDYTTSTGTLSFNGTVGDTDNITVSLLDDFTFEGDETFTIQFTAVSDGSVNITDTATGTILDNESDPNAPRPYEEREAINLEGNFKMKGNTNLQCVANCPGTPTSNNPSVVMGYADVDADATTVNSSYNNFTLPAGASVEWAGLYWGGLYNSSNSGITNPSGTLNIDQVKFMEPGASTYTTINAEVRNIETGAFSGWRSFMSHADVTSIVQGAGNGNYYVADIALATGSSFTGPYGGWTMVVVYSDPTEKTRRISIWDGFDFFGFGANENFTVTGLLTPGSGAFESHAGYFGFDGEASSSGDYVSVEGTALSNALNPSNNTLNGTISEFGVDVGGRSPNFNYSWGIDIDVFDASGLVPNGTTTVDVVLGSSSEGIWGGVFAISNEIAFPAVSSKTFAPTSIFMGDEATVTLVVDNPAKGVLLTNFSLTDNLPAGMIISPTPDATSSSGGTITAVPGSSTFAVSGINIPAGNTCTFTFDIVTSDIGTYLNTLSPLDITNDQNIPLEGESSGSLTVKVKTVITNRRITYRVNN